MISSFLLLLSFNSFAIENGIYKCQKGNNRSICKQKIRIQEDKIHLTYVGYCYGMGSNTFFCQDNVCHSGNQEIILFQEGYSWESKSYNIKCDLFLPTEEGELP